MTYAAFGLMPPSVADHLTVGNLCRYAVSELVPNQVKQIAQKVTSFIQSRPIEIAFGSVICAWLLPDYKKYLFYTIAGFSALCAKKEQWEHANNYLRDLSIALGNKAFPQHKEEVISNSVAALFMRVQAQYAPLQWECRQRLHELMQQPDYPGRLYKTFLERHNQLMTVYNTTAQETVSFANSFTNLINEGREVAETYKRYNKNGTLDRIRVLHRMHLRLSTQQAETLNRCFTLVLKRASQSSDPLLPHLKQAIKEAKSIANQQLTRDIEYFRQYITHRDSPLGVFDDIERLNRLKFSSPSRFLVAGGHYKPFKDRSNDHKDR